MQSGSEKDCNLHSARLARLFAKPDFCRLQIPCVSAAQQHLYLSPQSLFEQVVRQRDLFKRLLDEAGAPGNSQPGQLSLPAPGEQATTRAEVQPHRHIALVYVKTKSKDDFWFVALMYVSAHAKLIASLD